MSSRNGAAVAVASPAALVLACATFSCAGTLEDPERFAIDGGTSLATTVDGSSSIQSNSGAGCDATVVALFPARCASAGCHSATDKTAGLDLESPDVRARLMGAAATGGPGVLVDPGGDPQKSVLYLKLTPAPPFGAQMPLTGAKLDDATLSCVAQWIAAPVDGADASTASDARE
jgi:hypothetical protein